MNDPDPGTASRRRCFPAALRRAAFFGGIYSNTPALCAAIADARARGAEALFCLGDLGGFGPYPERIPPILWEHDVVTVQGNYEDAVGHGKADCGCGYTDPRDNHFARLAYDYTLRKTPADQRAWFRTLPVSIRVDLGGRRLLLCHGSPRRQNEFLWESTSSDPFLERLLREYGTDILLCTHSGIPWSRRLPSGGLVVNVGVLGRPANDGRREVSYALLAAGEEGSPATVEQVLLAYDVEAFLKEMEQEGLPAEFRETIASGWWTTCLEVLPAKERGRGRF
jgi:diadenosine tetraphosphatase ApaH/serine/threonine PP2A family protein phosphatase